MVVDGKPLFSIVTATRNAGTTLRRTIDSVRAQTFGDFEYVVVDGGSTDGTRQLLESSRDVVTRFVSEPDRGISDAFNKGIAMARGELVGIVNADDWYEPDALETVARAVRTLPADVYCGLQQYWRGEERGHTFGVAPELLTRFMSVNHIASFARRELFTRHGGFKIDYRAAMDYELYLRFYLRGARFRAVDAVLANMSLGGVSDRDWKLGLSEVRRAQIENGIGAVDAYRTYLFHVAKGLARRWLERSRGKWMVDFYRKRIARVAKKVHVAGTPVGGGSPLCPSADDHPTRAAVGRGSAS